MKINCGRTWPFTSGGGARAILRFGSFTVRRRQRYWTRSRKEGLEAYAYLAPAGIVLFTFWFLPVLASILISFTNWKGGDRLENIRWIGLTNYRRALIGDKAEYMWDAFFNTVNYALYSVPITLVLALVVALLLNAPIKGRAFFRTVYFLPFITTWVAISIVWKYFYDPNAGVLNWLLGTENLDWLDDSRRLWTMWLWGPLGLGDVVRSPLLTGPSISMLAIIITSVWRDIGYYAIIFLAGLQNIDRSYYEAAAIDGASPAQQFWTITFPLLSPVTFFLLIISGIGAFKIFVPMLVMTPTGGPDFTTASMTFYLYQQGFTGSWLLGYASAVAYILFVIILLLTLLQNRLFGRKVHYES
ncbi:MAG: sugar ABC transporter permease [Candidatus Sumerlaeia bacterium]